MENLILESGPYRIGVASSARQFDEVETLIHRMYSWRGYATAAGSLARNANNATLQVRRDGLTVGTMTVRRDSDDGLPADQLYSDELDSVRQCGRTVCELTGLAIVPGEDSGLVLGGLFQYAYQIGQKSRISDVVIEVNPRHTEYYQRLLAFRLVGPERYCARVGAPAVLLHLELDGFAAGFEMGLAGLRSVGRRGPAAPSRGRYSIGRVCARPREERLASEEAMLLAA